MNELNLVEIQNISKISYVQDDISYDLLSFLGVSISIEKNSSITCITINDTLPSSFSNPASELNNYKTFINGTYANQTNLLDFSNNSLILLNTTRFENNPYIYFLNSNASLNLFYRYNNLSKNELIINESQKISNFSLQISLSSPCFNNNCSNATNSSWPWGVGDLFVTLNITDSNSNTIIVNGSSGGFLNASVNNTFWVNLTDSGIVNVTIGAYSGSYSLRMTSNSTLYSSIITILNASSEIKAILPVDLLIANQNFTNLIIKEK
jgi:hypothetical protein